MPLLRSSGRLLSPYSKTCVRVSFELLTYPYGRKRAKLHREDLFAVLQRKDRATRRAYGVPKIMLEFVKV